MPRVPLGKRARGDGDMPLEHQRKALAHLVRRLADGDRARDVGGAVEILRAAVDEEQLARPQLAVGRLADAIVDDGAVGAAAGDGVERNLAQLIGGPAEAFQAPHRLDLVERAGGGGAVEPGKEPGDGERRRADARHARP